MSMMQDDNQPPSGEESPHIHRISIDTDLENCKIDVFKELFGRSILRVELEPSRLGRFRHELAVNTVSDIAIGFHSATAMGYARTKELIADGRDDTALLILQKGSAVFQQREHEITLEPGNGLLIRNGDVGTLNIPDFAQYVSVCLPSSDFILPGPNADNAYLNRIFAGSAALQLVEKYTQMVMQYAQSVIAPETQETIAGQLRDLCLLVGKNQAYGTEALPELSGVRASRLHAIKTDIAARLSSHRLTLESLARAQNVSPRYICKLFAEDGITYSQYVLQRRLDRALKMLMDPASNVKRISEIALECGFGDLSHFNRSFRRRFGMTPSEVRNER